MSLERLTPTEIRVASRAAAAETSGDIGRDLGLSARTVEAHLLRIYRKLGIRSRAELGRHVGRTDLQGNI